jgi:hypothetical protein
MSGSELRGWKLLKIVPLQEQPGATTKAYVWEHLNNPAHEVVRVDVTERDTWRLAQENLREHLLESVRPDIPKGTKNLAEIGDISYVGREPETDVVAAVSFSRGNVFVSVASVGDQGVDVSDIAAQIDRALREPPGKGALSSRKARAIAPKVVTVEANKACALIPKLDRAARAGEWLKVIVPDGELSRKGNGLLYVSKQQGTKQVSAFAVNGAARR